MVLIAVAILVGLAGAYPYVLQGLKLVATKAQQRDLNTRAKSSDSQTRVSALTGLAVRRDPGPSVIEELASIAVGDEPPEIRGQALAGLRSAARNQELPAEIWDSLIAELEDEPPTPVLAALLTALGSDEQSFQAVDAKEARVVDLARGHEDVSVRQAAIRLLAGLAWQGQLSQEGEMALVAIVGEQRPANEAVPSLTHLAAAALGGLAEHGPLSSTARSALYETTTQGHHDEQQIAVQTLQKDRRLNAPGGYPEREIETHLASIRAEADERARLILERQRQAAAVPEPTRVERIFGRERIGGNLYFAAIWISGLICAAWLVYYLARILVFLGERSRKVLRGLLAIGLWVPASVGTGYLFFIGLFLFGHNSTPPPSRQLQLAAAAFGLAAIYAAAGWVLSLLVRK
jgi:hypothetical protein